MNTQQRIMEAQRVLELALKEYLKTASKKERLLAGIALNFDAELADTLGKKGVLFVAGGIAKAIIDTENGESVGKQLEGILGDLATMGITSAGYFVKRTPLGFAVSTAMDLAGIDLSSFLKHYYDVITGDKDALLLDEIEIKVYGGVLKVTMKDGTVYARPIDPNGTYDRSIYGKSGDDVLFGGTGNDHLNGLGGNNILVGGKGADHYKANNGDTIIDSDGQGYVELGLDRLNGGKWDKDKNAYVGGISENIYYTLDKNSGTLTVKSDAGTITIENYSKDKNSLGIVLQDPDEVLVTIHDNQANEGGFGKHTLGFRVSLDRRLEKGEYLTLNINGQIVKFTEYEQTKDNAYVYEWNGNESKNEDNKFSVVASVVADKSNVKATIKNSGQGLIKDDDKDDDDDLPELEVSPIVIDLDNNGINSHALNYTINFDLDSNGFKEATGWVSDDDALLAIDKNGNGVIDNGSELFGNKSISDSAFSYTNANLNNGFETLKAYDTNNDNIIDDKDAEFDKLLLWQDKNGNAITDNGELIKLSDKVTSIDLNYTNTDINNNGNTIRQTSIATLNDGTKVKADDIWFKVNYKDTEEIIDENQIPFEIKALPNVKAFGNSKEFINLNLLVA